jgi:hypothetical protein
MKIQDFLLEQAQKSAHQYEKKRDSGQAGGNEESRMD